MDNLKWYETYRYLLLVARSIIQYPNVQSKMTKEYEKNKALYYKTAKDNEDLNEVLMPRGRIEDIVVFRQNLGVLIVARDDKALRLQVIEHLYNAHPKLKSYVKQPQANNDFARMFIHNLKPELRFMGMLYIASYVSVYVNNENDLSNTFLVLAKATIETFSKAMESYEEVEPWTNAKAFSELGLQKEDWQLIKSIKGGETISNYCTAFRQNMFQEDGENYPELVEYPNETDSNIHAAFSSIVFSLLLATDLNWEDLFGNSIITKSERIKILQKSVDFGDACGGYKPLHYLISMVIYMLAKRIYEMNEYFIFQDAEAKTLEVQHLKEENGKYLKRLSVIEKENEKLKKELSARDKQAKNELKKTEESFKEKIKSLEQENKNIKEQLVNNSNNIHELEKLRYFMLDNEEEIDAFGQDVDLNQILQDKRIVVVGGHVNWRNKLKNRFPNLSIHDGINTIIDLNLFDSADYVVFFTAHMSHKTYERIINYIKSKNVQYGFLQPTTNLDIFEKQLLCQINKSFDD